MKVSRTWLQTYFDQPLPAVAELADAFTFHAFEIEASEGEMLDVKVLPDRAAYALSHRGIAKEIAAILGIPMKRDPLKEPLPAFPAADALVFTADPAYTVRHVGALVKGVTVGPSPAWLKEKLESVDQRSINNIVDILNFVMLDIGQPAGAFDVGKMKLDDGVVKIDVRRARKGEKITILTGEEMTLTENMFVFTDAVGGSLLDIAGIKGGLASGVTETTKDLFISVGNYDSTLLRRAAQTLKLFTDASQRYQNKPSPELAAYGMRDILALIAEVAGGELVGVVDVSHAKTEKKPVSVSAKRVSELLGREYPESEVTNVLERLGLPFTLAAGVFTVTPSFERNDIEIPEDLAEEVGRIAGYETLEPKVFASGGDDTDQARFRGIERVKDFLVERGFTEISTQSFAKKGDIGLANPLDVANPFLRAGLAANMAAAKKQAKNYAPLVLEPGVPLRLFELGNVFTQGGEKLVLAVSEKVDGLDEELGVPAVSKEGVFEYDLSQIDLEKYGTDFMPKRYVLKPFTPYSIYPFVLRDVAVWTPEGTKKEDVEKTIKESASTLLYRIDFFDTFTKDGQTSHAFRLVFQSPERTLTDDEVGAVMGAVTTALEKKTGWKVR